VNVPLIVAGSLAPEAVIPSYGDTNAWPVTVGTSPRMMGARRLNTIQARWVIANPDSSWSSLRRAWSTKSRLSSSSRLETLLPHSAAEQTSVRLRRSRDDGGRSQTL
jgi:hypothetical protein